MIIRPNDCFETGCAAHLLGGGGLDQCAIVDAHEEDLEAYLGFATSKYLPITHAIGTHVHANRGSGGPALARKVGASYGLHESADVELRFEPLHDSHQQEAAR